MFDRARRAVRRRRTSVSVVVSLGPLQVRHLREALASLDAQAEAPDQILVSPWGSTELPIAALDLPESIRVLPPSVNANAARNAGTVAAGCDTVLHLEATEVLEPQGLAVLTGQLAASADSVAGRGGLAARLWRRAAMPRFDESHGRFPVAALEAAPDLEINERLVRHTDRTWAAPFGTVPSTAAELPSFTAALDGVEDPDLLVDMLGAVAPAMLDDLEHAEPDAVSGLRAAVAAALRRLPASRRLDLPVEDRLRLWLVARGRHEEMSRFTADRWFADGQHPTRLVGERLLAVLDVPDVPDEVLEIRPRLEVSLRRVRYDGQRVRLTVFAACRWIDLRANPPQFRARMSHAHSGARVALSPESRPDRAATRHFRMLHQNHDAAGLEITVDPAWLTIEGAWALEIGMSAGGVTLWGRVTDRDARSSAGVPDAGPHARATFETGLGFCIHRGGRPEVRRLPDGAPEVTSVDLGRTIVLRGEATSPFELEFCSGEWRIPVDVAQEGRDFVAEVPLHHEPWGFASRPLPSGTWHLSWRSGDRSGDLPIPPALAGRTPRERLTGTHRIRLMRGLRDQVLVELSAPLRDEEFGPWAQERLRAAYAASDRPVDPRLALFHTYAGAGVTDSPLAIHDELRRRQPAVRTLWAVADRSVQVPDGSQPVLLRSREWYDALAVAGTVVTNIEMARFFRTRPGQRLVQTFHGYPSKAMGMGLWRSKNFSPLRVERQLDNTARQWSVACVPSPEMEQHYREQYAFEGPYLNQGYPRDDVLVGPAAAAIRDEARRRIGIGADQVAVLYAPTWRDDLATNFRAAPLHAHLDVGELAERLGPDHVVLLRGHRFHRTPGTAARVRDVSAYPEVNDLILAADVAVLDYSSLRFDFALTGKPMVFLVPDLVEYADEKRGFLFPFTNSAPGPLVDTTAEVVDALRDVSALAQEWAPAIDEFNATYNAWQDGRSAARAVDLLFG